MKCVFSSDMGDSWARYFPSLGAGAPPKLLPSWSMQPGVVGLRQGL